MVAIVAAAVITNASPPTASAFFICDLCDQPSERELRTVAEVIERFRVLEGIYILYRAPVNDLSHGNLADLAVACARDVRHLDDTRRNMPRRGVLPDHPPDTV